MVFGIDSLAWRLGNGNWNFDDADGHGNERRESSFFFEPVRL